MIELSTSRDARSSALWLVLLAAAAFSAPLDATDWPPTNAALEDSCVTSYDATECSAIVRELEAGDHNDPAVLWLLARAYEGLSLHERGSVEAREYGAERLRLLHRIHGIIPGDVETLLTIAYAQQNEYDKIHWFQRALSVDPKNFQAHWGIATNLQRLRRKIDQEIVDHQRAAFEGSEQDIRILMASKLYQELRAQKRDNEAGALTLRVRGELNLDGDFQGRAGALDARSSNEDLVQFAQEFCLHGLMSIGITEYCEKVAAKLEAVQRTETNSESIDAALKIVYSSLLENGLISEAQESRFRELMGYPEDEESEVLIVR